MKIELSDNQVKKFNDWKKSFDKLPHIGATGGHFGINILFTSIGQVITAVAWNGTEIDLTEYENM